MVLNVAAEELRSQLAAIVASASDAIFSKTLAGVITSWNRAAEELYGYTAAEAIGAPISIIIPPDRPNELPELLERLRRGERVPPYETVRLNRRGHHVHVALTLSPILDACGAVVGASVIAHDIGEQRRLRQTQDQLIQLLDLSYDAIFARDENARITFWNRGAEALYGWRAAEALGQRSHSLLSTAFPNLAAPIDELLARDGRWEGELRHTRKDGRPIVVDSRQVRLATGDGTPPVTLETNRDITARKRMEADLRESVERLQLAASVTGFGLYDDRGDGRVYWSPELKALLGFSPGFQPDGGVAAALERIHPDDRKVWLHALAAARDPTGPGDMASEHRIVRLDGTTIWVSQLGRTLFEGDGATRHSVRAIGIVDDITARKQAESDRDGLVAAITHDVKSPLTAVSGTAQLLQRWLARSGGIEPERLADCLAQMLTGTTRVVQMMDELLDLARVRGGQSLALHRSDCDLVALARQVVDEQQRQTDRHRIRPETNAARLKGVWDRDRLHRVLTNLVGNAVKYSPDGGDVAVSVRRESGQGGAVLVVQDHGLGIPAADLPYVFEYFHRGSNVTRRISGSGIGLAGARQIVEGHGGTIEVESQEGRGTTVTVRLPYSVPDSAGPILSSTISRR